VEAWPELTLPDDIPSIKYGTSAYEAYRGICEQYFLIVAYEYGMTPPLTCQNGVAVAGPSFTIDGLSPNQQIVVRVCARNSEGETSPGITATGQTTLPLLPGDYNGDLAVDAACGGRH
jgi:hypothetical protein